MWRRTLRTVAALAAVAGVTALGRRVPGINAATMGFAYLLLVLAAATLWGFVEAMLVSIAATVTLNFFFLPPIARLTIADPQNWVALFSFLVTALVASRLSATARRRTREALARQQDLERLYGFSRALLLIEPEEAFPAQLTRKLALVFDLEAVMLYEPASGAFHRAGPVELEGWEERLRQSAASGQEMSAGGSVAMPVRLGAGPIAALALRPDRMPAALRQGLANLVAIALEHARVQELGAQVEAAQRGEKLRTALLDALEHEFKTPLTSVLAATSALLAAPDTAAASRAELLQVADEEARRLRLLMDDALAMARLDPGALRPEAEPVRLGGLVRDALEALGPAARDRPVVVRDPAAATAWLDRRLLRLALKQLLDNALKYSPPGAAVEVEVVAGPQAVAVEVTDHGAGIPPAEQARIFERLYRSPGVENRIPGSGLGLGIALSIARAHGGDLTLRSRPGETVFRLSLPAAPEAAA